MIRGNERAIDLGLELLAALKPNCALTLEEIAAYIEAAREVLELPTQPFRWNDLWYLERRALRKMSVHLQRQKITSTREYCHSIQEKAA